MRASKPKWLLLADIHFKHQDLDRITKTAAWIKAVAKQHKVRRVVVCGDLLTSRASQPTHVLSSCYRFLDSLVNDADVANLHIVLGNHDLAYRRDYTTTALDALRLAYPAVQVHHDIESHEWDGRRVLTLPFREDQSELAEAVAALGQKDAGKTVAFAHLALHKAVTQRHVVHPSSDATRKKTGTVRYRGLMGPGNFSSLARTFTGHFHSHQTILQQSKKTNDRLHGSVTYIGSPLQLTWADLWDEQRGVILLDPKTLDHELVVNPDAMGYMTIGVDEILNDNLDKAAIHDKHVMLLGDLTRYKYATARDKLVSGGARSVRSWSPMAPRLQTTVALQGLGTSTPASDASMQRKSSFEMVKVMDDVAAEEKATPGPSNESHPTPLVLDSDPNQSPQVDMQEQVVKYVGVLDLDKSLVDRRDSLVQVGRKLLEAAISEQAEEDSQGLGGGEPEVLSYQSIISTQQTDDAGSASFRVGTTAKPTLKSASIFNAKPRSLTITNFLGIQSTVHLDYGTDIKRGLTFVVGENGSGKSTLVEAMVWCQFGRCLRSGLGANDVVNDKKNKNCSVRLEFDNGYAIHRFRKHKEFGNRTLIEKDGTTLPEFEKADARSTQAAIDELLGVSYDTFVRTIVLGHESATSFLSSTPSQRRDLILSVLGLGVLDRCAVTTRRMLRELGDNMTSLQSKINGKEQALEHAQKHIKQLEDTKKRFNEELEDIQLQMEEVVGSFEMREEAMAGDAIREREKKDFDDGQPAEKPEYTIDDHISEAQEKVTSLLRWNQVADIRRSFEDRRSSIQNQRLRLLQRLAELEAKHSQLSSKKQSVDAELAAEEQPSGRANTLTDRFLAIAKKIYDRLLSVDASLRSAASHRSSPLPLEQPEVVARLQLRLLLGFFRRVFALMANSSKDTSAEKSKAREKGELYAQRLALKLKDRDEKISEHQEKLSRPEYIGSDKYIIEQLATDLDASEDYVRDSLNEVSAVDAKSIFIQLNTALSKLAELQSRRELEAAKPAEIDKLRALSHAKYESIKTYEQIIERDTAARQKLCEEREALQKELSALGTDRGLLEFWASALAQKSRRVSSASSNSSTSSSRAAVSYTFREFILEQSLKELNTATTQILAMLFEHSRHATALTTGMLQHLFVEEDADRHEEDQVTALDSSLAVDARLSYGKRSGGERKRIDLALFFALLYIGQSRSQHRAHYMLVDEVFDSLDDAGQAAVVKWCDFMAATKISYVMVITHSDDLVLRGTSDVESGQDRSAGGSVLTVKMGKDGVELEMEGTRVGSA